MNGFRAKVRAREMLYVGRFRPRSQLVVVGNLDATALPGAGGGVRKRLLDAAAWRPPVLS